MLISIIIPVLNRAKVVTRTLDSVAAQTHRPLQLVLVDNDSDDNTLAVLTAFKEQHQSDDFIIDITTEKKRTAGAARNRGFEMARGEWVLFFDSDDLMHPELVESYARTIEKTPRDLDVVVVRRDRLTPDGRRVPYPLFHHDILANHLLHSTMSTLAYASRREFFAACGGWNEDLPVWNDYEMGWRVLLAQPRTAWIDEPLVDVVLSGEESITGTNFHSRQGAWEQVLDSMNKTTVASTIHNVRRYVRLINYRRLVLAAHYEMEGQQHMARQLRQQAMDRFKDSRWLTLTLPWLYRRIAAGRRGSARIARLLIR